MTQYENTKKWIENNRDKNRSSQFKYRQRKRMKLFNEVGLKCVHCGTIDERVLQLDHINGGGTQDRKRCTSTHQFYSFYLNDVLLAKKTLQTLCANCNIIKRYENQEYGNKRMKLIALV